MPTKVATVQAYIKALPETRITPFKELRKVVLKNLPKGFVEVMGYGMPSYVVPHSLYPAGYHCDPKLPVPFLSLASQKNFIAVYHMGLYADANLLKWFIAEYAKLDIAKLDMGKSCIRFKKPEQIPFKLLGNLVGKMTPKQWISVYEKNIKR